RSAAIGAAVISAAIAGAAIQSTVLSPAFGQDANRRLPVPREQIEQAMSLSNTFRAVTRSISPSVVNIISVQRAEMPQVRTPEGQVPFDDELFRRFFDLPEGMAPPEGQMPQ